MIEELPELDVSQPASVAAYEPGERTAVSPVTRFDVNELVVDVEPPLLDQLHDEHGRHHLGVAPHRLNQIRAHGRAVRHVRESAQPVTDEDVLREAVDDRLKLLIRRILVSPAPAAHRQDREDRRRHGGEPRAGTWTLPHDPATIGP